jgi:hypothetical protein
VWTLVAKGLPTIGAGRSKRVDVARADAWLRERRDHVDDALGVLAVTEISPFQILPSGRVNLAG